MLPPHKPSPCYNQPTNFQLISRVNTLDQNVRKKLNEIRQKQLESDIDLQANEPSTASGNKSLKIAALGGVAAGLIIAWFMNSFLPTDNVDLIAQRSSVAIYENKIREANEKIEQLYDRVELLTESISGLEAELTQAMVLVKPNNEIEKTTITDQSRLEPADERPVSTLVDSHAPGLADSAATNDKAFKPTHIVKTRLNLRTATSLDDAPIGVLTSGTEVRYIDETNGWYYVDTEQFGIGWCASKFLSPLSSPYED